MRYLSEYPFLIALVFAVGILTAIIFWPFFAPLALGMIFAVVLQPLYKRILTLLRGQESLASFLTVIISIVLLIIPLVILGNQLVQEVQALYASMNVSDIRAVPATWLNQFEPTIDRYVPNGAAMFAEFNQNLGVYTQQAVSWVVQHTGVAFSGIASFFLQTFIFLMTLYYLLRDGARLKQYVVEISPLKDSDDEIIFEKLGAAVNSVVKGKLFIGLIQGILSGIGFVAFGIPSPILWGFVAAIFSIVPPMGTALVVTPAILYLLATGAMLPAIGLTLWGVLAVGLIDNILGPKLMGRGMQLHPLLVLLAVLGGLAFFGPVGLFLGPLTVSLLVALLALYRHFSRVEEVVQ